VKDCISTLTRCYGIIRDYGKIDGVVCSVPEVQVRMPCHKSGEGSDACDDCRELRAYQRILYLDGIAGDEDEDDEEDEIDEDEEGDEDDDEDIEDDNVDEDDEVYEKDEENEHDDDEDI